MPALPNTQTGVHCFIRNNPIWSSKLDHKSKLENNTISETLSWSEILDQRPKNNNTHWYSSPLPPPPESQEIIFNP